jgi:rubredoxin
MGNDGKTALHALPRFGLHAAKGPVMTFNSVPIVWTCTCGFKPSRVKVSVTSLGSLMADWFCPECQDHRKGFIDINDMIAGIPPAPVQQVVVTAADQKWLAAMHINFS